MNKGKLLSGFSATAITAALALDNVEKGKAVNPQEPALLKARGMETPRLSRNERRKVKPDADN